MKTTRIRFLILLTFVLIGSFSYAQRGRGHGHGHGRGHGRHHDRVVIRRSPYRPAKVVVYHPHWHPTYAYHRRWVYFPRYNMYWDNWRNHYVYLNGPVWVSQPSPPPIVVNVNLDKEKSSELREDEDDNDDIYKSNDSHKSGYKPE